MSTLLDSRLPEPPTIPAPAAQARGPHDRADAPEVGRRPDFDAHDDGPRDDPGGASAVTGLRRPIDDGRSPGRPTILGGGTRPDDGHEPSAELEPGPDGRAAAEEPDELHVRRRLRATRPRTGWRPVARGRHLVSSARNAGQVMRGELREAGMATAEYAIATLAAVGFAGLLVVILKGNEVRGLLLGIVRQALSL